MAGLEDLEKSISDMSNEELDDLIGQIRDSRKNPRIKPKKKAAAKSKPKKAVDVTKMSPEEQAALKKLLGLD